MAARWGACSPAVGLRITLDSDGDAHPGLELQDASHRNRPLGRLIFPTGDESADLAARDVFRERLVRKSLEEAVDFWLRGLGVAVRAVLRKGGCDGGRRLIGAYFGIVLEVASDVDGIRGVVSGESATCRKIINSDGQDRSAPARSLQNVKM